MRALALNPALLDNFINPKKGQSELEPDFSEINAVIRNGINYVRRIHSGIPTWKRFLFPAAGVANCLGSWCWAPRVLVKPH